VLRNGELIGNVLSGEALEFNDHNRSSEQLDTYTIIAFDANGIQNSSTVITLQ